MPILNQGPPAWASIISGLLNAGGQTYAGIQQAKQAKEAAAEKKRQADALAAYQQWQMQHGDAELSAKGLVKGKDGTWSADPKIASIMSGSDSGASNSPGVGTPAAPKPPAGAPGGAAAMGLGQPAAQPPLGNVPPGIQGMLAGIMNPSAPAAPQAPQKPSTPSPEVMETNAMGKVDAARKLREKALQISATWPDAPQARTLNAQADELEGEAREDWTNADRIRKRAEGPQPMTLKYPANWNKMTPQQKEAYLQQRLNAAQSAHRPDVESSTNAEIGRIETSANQDRTDARDRQFHNDMMNLANRKIDVRVNAGGRPKTLTPYEQIEVQHWNLTHNKDGTTKKAASGKPDVNTERDTDYEQMLQAIAKHPERKDEFVKRYANKYRLKADDVNDNLPDDDQ